MKIGEEFARSSLRISLGLFLLSPFLIWLYVIQEWNGLPLGTLAWPLLNSLWQASVSTLATVVCGFALFRALQSWTDPKSYRFAESVLLLPNLVPALFLGLGLLGWTVFLGAFPFGVGAVIIAHVILNSGLLAVSLDRLFKEKAGGVAEAAWVMGAGPMEFCWRVAWPMLRGDLASLILFIFALSFTSFSLPLLLSGERVVTLEIAIFDAIRSEGQWDKAVLLAVVQTLSLFLLTYLLPRPLWPRALARVPLPFMALRFFKWAVWLPLGILLGGWMLGTLAGLAIGLEAELVPAIFEGLLTSAVVGLVVGLLHVLIFFAIAYVSPHQRLNQFLNGYLSPSPAITGFAMLLLPVESSLGRLGLLCVALTLISLPLLYRWMVHSVLMSLRQQVTVARSLGARWSVVLFEVVGPQAAPAILRASGLAALWASGDFALSGILLGDEVTLPILAHGMVGHYRFDSAQLLLFPLLAVGLGLYGLFVGAARHVAR